MRTYPFWTPGATALLLEMRAAGLPLAEIAARLDTTVHAVNGRMRTLGLPRRPQFRWTPDADARLQAHYQTPRAERPPLKVAFRSWPSSPTPDAAYQRASLLGLVRGQTDAESS